jgi:hypothetical protein
MPIKVYSDRIEIGSKTITTTPTGIRIGDSLAANSQQQGYVRQANFTARELEFGNFAFQGSVAGFVAGGSTTSFQGTSTLDRFPFATDTNATNVANLFQSTWETSSASSTTHGYCSGGYVTLPTRSDITHKFSFSSPIAVKSVGTLASGGRYSGGGQSSSTHGYATNQFPSRSAINKFPFSTDSNSTIAGSTTDTAYAGGHSSSTHGYSSGGLPTSSIIEKFSFSTDANATLAGYLNVAVRRPTGASSTTHGYVIGGIAMSPPGPAISTIQKFPFSADSNSISVANLTNSSSNQSAGISARQFGYRAGGSPSVSTIDKFPFATDSNASSVGNLSGNRFGAGGNQD